MMLGLLGEKLLLILMEDGEDMEEGLSLEKILLKLIDRLHMPPDGLLRILLLMDSVEDVWFKLLMLLGLPSQCQSMLIAMGLLLKVLNNLNLGYTDHDLELILFRNFDLRPGVIIKELNLKRPIYKKTASGCHFGREDPDFTWEAIKDLSH